MKFILVGISIFALFALQFRPVFASDDNTKFAPPDAKPYGKSLAQWGEAWWRYIMRLPADVNPLNDTTGANCGVEQSGHVFFLVGTTGGGPVTRNGCVVPVGKALFFPIVNIMCAVPDDGPTSKAVYDLCSLVMNHGEYVHDLAVTLDDVKLTNPESYHFISPEFSFVGDPNNIYINSCTGSPYGECYAGPRAEGFSDGYWTFIQPLSPGSHTISIYGEVNSPLTGVAWTVDVTYNLTVK
jgi:hypothetical protein